MGHPCFIIIIALVISMYMYSLGKSRYKDLKVKRSSYTDCLLQDTASEVVTTQTSPSPSHAQMIDLVPGRRTEKISTSQLHACQRKTKGSGTAMALLLLVVYFDIRNFKESCARASEQRVE